jgi:hypothetical protein
MGMVGTLAFGWHFLCIDTPDKTHLFEIHPREHKSYNIKWRRMITNIHDNKITLNAPVVQAIEKAYGGAMIYKYSFAQEIENVGIENLLLKSTYASEWDENHGRSAVTFQRVSNAWMRHVTAKHFWFGAVKINRDSIFVTVEDSAMLQHKGLERGGRRYSFYISDNAEFILFQRCFAKDGRHDFVSGSRTPGPNVWVDAVAIWSSTDSGPHDRYSTGQLFDNVKVRKTNRAGELSVRNRGGSGTGHGWSGAQILFWNTEADVAVDAPNGAMNYAIGNVGEFSNDWGEPEPHGIVQSMGKHVDPRSLYYTQLAERMGQNALNSQLIPAQKEGPIWSMLISWRGDGLFMDPVVVLYDEDSGPLVPQKMVKIWGLIRDLNLLDGFLSFEWKLMNGPGTVRFARSGRRKLETGVSFDSVGTYTLSLVVNGGMEVPLSIQVM